MIDLHIHTTNSDGTDSVEEILKKAEKLKLNYISISDHDTCKGYDELKNIDVESIYSGKIIPGIELKCYYKGRTIEVLGYNINVEKMNNWITTFYKDKSIRYTNTTDLEKGFKSIYGTTIFAYSRMNKMKKAKELLEDNKLSILEISLAVGYSNGGKFSKAFKETFGMLPTEYRREIKVKRSYRAKN